MVENSKLLAQQVGNPYVSPTESVEELCLRICFSVVLLFLTQTNRQGGFRGGGGADLDRNSTPCRPPFPQEFDPLPTQRVPLSTILRYSYLMSGPKNILKAPMAPIYTTFEGGARAKNAIFWSKLHNKCLKMRVFQGLFFKILPAAQRILPKPGLFSASGELV